MIKNITKQTIESILSEYNTQYLLVDGKGCVCYEHRYIAVNPTYSKDEDIKTLSFGIIAHYFNELQIDVTLKELEKYASEILENKEVYNYLSNHKISRYNMNCSYDELPKTKQLGWKE